MAADLGDQRIDLVVNAEETYFVAELMKRVDHVALADRVVEREDLAVVGCFGRRIRVVEDHQDLERTLHGPLFSRPVNR